MWTFFLLLLQPSFGTRPPIRHVSKGSLGTVVNLWLRNPQSWGPPPRRNNILHMPQNDWRDHLEGMSVQRPHNCNPRAQWAIDMQRSTPHLSADIADLRDAMSDETQLWFEFETLPTADDAHTSPAHNTSPLHGGIPTDPVVARQDVPQLRPTWPAAAGGQLAYTPGPQISDPAAWAGYAPSTTNTHNANSSNTRLMTIGRSWPQRLPKKLNRVGWQGRLSRQRIGKPRRRACAPSSTPTLSFHYYTRIRLWPLRSAYNKPAPTGGPKSGGAKTGVEAATTRPVPCTINHTITHPTTTCSARTSAPTLTWPRWLVPSAPSHTTRGGVRFFSHQTGPPSRTTMCCSPRCYNPHTYAPLCG